MPVRKFNLMRNKLLNKAPESEVDTAFTTYFASPLALIVLPNLAVLHLQKSKCCGGKTRILLSGSANVKSLIFLLGGVSGCGAAVSLQWVRKLLASIASL